MELFALRHSEWEQLYNCTGVLAQMEALYPIETRSFPILAWTLILLSALYTALYVPCLVSIWNYTDLACYKLLFYIGVVDLAELCVIGFYHGFLSLNETLFCACPAQMYIGGAFASVLWTFETTADLILAMNRCIDMVAPRLADKLFKGKRACYWIAAATVYGLLFFAFVPGGVFVPMYFSWFFNPFTGLRDDPEELYNHRMVWAHNLLLATAYPAFYLCFLIALTTKIRKSRQLMSTTANTGISSSVNHAQTMIFIQVAILSALNMFVALVYNYMEYFPVPKLLIIVAHFSWMHIHGLPPVIYLTLNKTIRTDCKGYVLRVAKTFSHSSANTLTPVVNLQPNH